MNGELPAGWDWSVHKKDEGLLPFTVQLSHPSGQSIYGHGASCEAAGRVAMGYLEGQQARAKRRKAGKPEGFQAPPKAEAPEGASR